MQFEDEEGIQSSWASSWSLFECFLCRPLSIRADGFTWQNNPLKNEARCSIVCNCVVCFFTIFGIILLFEHYQFHSSILSKIDLHKNSLLHNWILEMICIINLFLANRIYRIGSSWSFWYMVIFILKNVLIKIPRTSHLRM